VPVAAALLGTDGSGALRDPAVALPPVPVYDFPEAAVRAIGHAAWQARWRRRPTGQLPLLSTVDVQAARTLTVSSLAARAGGGWLAAAEATALLAAFGIPTVTTIPASTADGAVAAADGIGYPVALKATGGVVHKTEAGGVRLDLADSAAVRAAFGGVDSAGGRPGGGVIVQPMAAHGVELLVGATRVDPYPPLLLVGLGGTATELLADRSVRLAPLTDRDATEMLRGLRAYPLLTGYRGAPPADVAAVEDLLLRVSTLVEEIPELAELDLNPVVATPAGATVLDTKIRIAPVPADADLLVDPLIRRLR
jgi:acyl-CoA synthetase (NDP forming)